MSSCNSSHHCAQQKCTFVNIFSSAHSCAICSWRNQEWHVHRNLKFIYFWSKMLCQEVSTTMSKTAVEAVRNRAMFFVKSAQRYCAQNRFKKVSKWCDQNWNPVSAPLEVLGIKQWICNHHFWNQSWNQLILSTVFSPNTKHKSQGLTLEKVVVELGDILWQFHKSKLWKGWPLHTFWSCTIKEAKGNWNYVDAEKDTEHCNLLGF